MNFQRSGLSLHSYLVFSVLLFSKQENSPRTSFESDDLEEADEENSEEVSKTAVSRPRTILRQGSFHIEDTQVQNSHDSGYRERGSNKSSVASSSNSSLAGTPDGASGSPRNTVSVGLGGKKMVSAIMEKFRIRRLSGDAQVKVVKVGPKNGQSLLQNEASNFAAPGQSQNQLKQSDTNGPHPVINITSASEVDATIAANSHKLKAIQDSAVNERSVLKTI